MVIEQNLKSIKVTKLKSLQEVEITFKKEGLTAIIGVNGSGKTTVLHALACCYDSATENVEAYQFPRFFRATTFHDWKDAMYSINYSSKNIKKGVIEDKIQTIYKNERWTPRYGRRAVRDVYYIGIETCVPIIEIYKKGIKVDFTKELKYEDSQRIKILENAKKILKKDYNEFSEISNQWDSKFIGLKHGDVKYSSFTMGAGEQRIFKILQIVESAEAYSLILIDELDLLLHIQAFNELIKYLIDASKRKKLQIIFTTHEKEIENFKEKLDIRHLYQTKEKTLCFNGINLEALYNLTGIQSKLFNIYVEDVLSKAIIEKIFSDLKLKKYLNVTVCGAIDNLFTLGAGLVLNNSKLENVLIVLDGDKYRSEEEKKKQIEKKITGDGEKVLKEREKVLNLIYQYELAVGKNPEEFLYEIILENKNENEIYNLVSSIDYVSNKHDYLSQIINRLGDSKEVGYYKIIEEVSNNPKWLKFVEKIKEWVESKKGNL